MADAAQVADGFFTAWTARDFGRARSLLHDDVLFEGRSTASGTPTVTSPRSSS
jgi:hypothetical protein